ncbi:hypothetical protein PseudUWO311_17670 [Pseudanabaena sp. UWO311]|uniref:hypothetical protein n=1 Tax=Pseudanabaena sp. UWO311 TaxID=2487337 RepID=UPI001158C17E|nr:hypothetical protein [Pseudanabaena sp. UWO311]TYQ24844.1 hypothetical protein PseudUWO311_17670 [Pseudanabaena sp. UWO311]
MNLLFLVEGATTEYQIYRAWLLHLLPNLKFVARPEDNTNSSCRIIIGGGYPSIFSRIESCLADIKKFGNIDYFFICLDSEEETYQDRYDEVNDKLETLKVKVGIEQSQTTKFHIIIQNCCMETWFLGNAEIPLKSSTENRSRKFLAFKDHYNVLVDDPEMMTDHPPSHSYRTKAKFHKAYLNEYLRGFGLGYIQSNPTIIAEKEYLEALIERCRSTNHLSSLKYLLDIWDEM